MRFCVGPLGECCDFILCAAVDLNFLQVRACHAVEALIEISFLCSLCSGALFVPDRSGAKDEFGSVQGLRMGMISLEPKFPVVESFMKVHTDDVFEISGHRL